jgi:hypothetical protein
MLHRNILTILLIGTSLILNACGDGGKVSELGFDPMRAAMDKGETAFRDYVSSVAGTRVKWSGRVVKAEKTFEDDYVPVARLYVDADTAVATPPVADLVFEFSLDDLEKHKPANSITFIAIIREVTDFAGKKLLRMELKSIES